MARQKKNKTHRSDAYFESGAIAPMHIASVEQQTHLFGPFTLAIGRCSISLNILTCNHWSHHSIGTISASYRIGG